ATATSAPSSAKRSAMARPRPEAAPVTKALLPARRPDILSPRPEPVVLEHLAQPGLEDLAGRGVRDLGDEDDVVRKLPFGEPRGEVAQDVVLQVLGLVAPLAVAQRDDQQWPLAPARVRQPDDRRLGDRRVADGGV